jgi:cephalosporin hydroxylase
MSNAKKIISKEEFAVLNSSSADLMKKDENLNQRALNLLIDADKYRWVHQSSWFGEPLLNLPQDMFAIQEIIYLTRPEYVIEVGVAWGGGLLFSASMLHMLGGKGVIGVDIFIPDDLKGRIQSKGVISESVHLIEGDSTSMEVQNKICDILNGSKRVMVILDSYHTHDHVLNELREYSKYVHKGFYIRCGDTIVDKIPKQAHRPREWGPGNNPLTAAKQFLVENQRFVVDSALEKKLLLSCHPGGYLMAIE